MGKKNSHLNRRDIQRFTEHGLRQVFSAAVTSGFIDIELHGRADVGMPERRLNQLRIVSGGVSVGRVGVAELVAPALHASLIPSPVAELPESLP